MISFLYHCPSAACRHWSRPEQNQPINLFELQGVVEDNNGAKRRIPDTFQTLRRPDLLSWKSVEKATIYTGFASDAKIGIYISFERLGATHFFAPWMMVKFSKLSQQLQIT